MKTENLPATFEVKFLTEAQDEIRLTPDIVRNYCIQGRREFVTNAEIMYFMAECKARKLNPFKRECWLIKYSERDNATIAESIHSKRNKARAASDCAGWSKGILLEKDGQIVESAIPIVPSGSKLVGGYFRATPTNWSEPFEHFVSIEPYLKKKRDGGLTAFWSPEKQPEMIRKVAESQGLSALWGQAVGASYIPGEIVDAEFEPDKAETTTPEVKPETVGTDIYKATPDDPPHEYPDPETLKQTPSDTPSTTTGKSAEATSPKHSEEESTTESGGAIDPAETYIPENDPSNWWNLDKHWKFRKAKAFYLLCRIGFGLPFQAVKFQTTEGDDFVITEDDKSTYHEIAKANEAALGTLFDAAPEVKKMIRSKLISTCRIMAEGVEAFFEEAQEMKSKRNATA